MRPLAFILVAVALAATACNSGSDQAAGGQRGPAQDTTPSQSASTHRFTKSELARIILQPADAPAGMSFTKALSGAKTLDDLGFVLKADLAQIHALRLRAVRDAIFDSSTGRRRLSSRVWLFAQPKGAAAWLAKSRNDAVRFALQPFTSPTLADGSWAARGILNGIDVLTYAFRSANVVVVVSMLAPKSSAETQSIALAAAHKAVDRARPS